MLVSRKDKPKKCDRSYVIYGLTCSNCRSQYVGETERPLKHRITERKKDSSPFGALLKTEDHKFPDDVKILDTESRYLQRDIRRPYYIASPEPDLNQDKGSLSLIYNSIIKSCDGHMTNFPLLTTF